MWGPPETAPFPPTDPHGRYRPAANGRHRTARWFILAAVAVLVLVAPLAVPVKDPAEVEDEYSPSSMLELSAKPSSPWPIDISGFDTICAAADSGMVTLAMVCDLPRVGVVEVHIGEVVGVGGSATDVDVAARRGMRAATMTDTSDARFHWLSTTSLSSTLAPEVDAVRVSEPQALTWFDFSPPDVVPDDTPSQRYRDTQPVSVQQGLRQGVRPDRNVLPAQYGTDSYAATVALLNRDAGGESVMYTVTVISELRGLVRGAAEDMARRIDAADAA